MKKYLIIAILAIMGFQASAQQDAMLSQYMFNTMFINPAYAGSNNYWSTSLLYRAQWLQFDGSPRTQLLSIDGPLAQGKMGIGGIIMHDKIGVTNETDVLANYSYKIKFDNSSFAFGAKAGFSIYSAKFSDLVYWDSSDPIYFNNQTGFMVPKFGFGMYYYSEKYFAGISIPTLVAWDKDNNFAIDIDRSSFLRRHFYLNGGYVFTLNDNFKLKPTLLVKYVEAAPVQGDLNVTCIYKNVFKAGIAYRSNDALVGIVEYVANQKFRVGYAFDLTLTDIKSHSRGSHEIMIGFDFGKGLETKTPRIF